MKNKRLKNYLKLGIMLFGIVFLHNACEKDIAIDQTLEENNNAVAPIIKTLSKDNAGETFHNLASRFQIERYLPLEQKNLQGRTTQDTLGITVYTDVIKEVTLGDYKSYTMKIASETNQSSKFYNLTLEDKNGQPDMFVTQYTPTQNWLNNQNQVFEGNITTMSRDAFEAVPPDDDGGGTTDTGTGVGGTGSGYPPDPQGSPYYPTDCDGVVVVTYESIPYSCGCGDMPWDNCQGCTSSSPMWPGYHEIPYYYCDATDYGSDPWDNTGNPNTGGGGGSSGNGNGTSPDSIPITVLIPPGEECENPPPGDLNGDCQLDAYESCLLQGNSQEVCDCVADGNDLADCQEDVPCNQLNALSGDQEFMGIMTDLNTKSTTVNKEVGYIQKVDVGSTSGYSYDYIEEEDIDSEMNFTIPSGTTLKGFFHTHDDVEKHLPVFSLDDLYAIFAFFNPSFTTDGTCVFNNSFNIEEDFTMILITAHGTKLALKFDSNGREKLRQFGEKYFGDWNIDLSGLINIGAALPDTDRQNIMEKFDKIVKDKFGVEKKKQRFAKFLDKMDFGMSLYQVNDDFTQWEKINKSGDPTPCNNN